MKLIDLTGQRFGKWLVLHRADDHVAPNGDKIVMWKCRCDCGTETNVCGKNLRIGISTSCGCTKPALKAALEKRSADGCLYNRAGVVCEDQKCSTCGWNPCNTKLKNERLRKL